MSNLAGHLIHSFSVVVAAVRAGRPASLRAVEREERGVDVEQRLLLALGQPGVAQDGELDRAPDPVDRVDDPGPHVERLRGDPHRLGDLLQHLGGGLAQAALDLAQVRVGHPGLLGQLAERQPCELPLLLEVVTERPGGLVDLLADPLTDSSLGHVSIVLAGVSKCKLRGCASGHTLSFYAERPEQAASTMPARPARSASVSPCSRRPPRGLDPPPAGPRAATRPRRREEGGRSSASAGETARRAARQDQPWRHQNAARISPTGSPAPSTGTRPVSSSASASTPGSVGTPLRRSASAITTGRARAPPSSILSANARPSGSATA